MRFSSVVLAPLLAACVHVATADAATFARRTVDGTPVVDLSGAIVEGDYESFLRAVENTPNTRVVLQSDGGSVLTAIKIGDYIRSHGFTTLVAKDSMCASACAIIWMAGVQRAVGARAQVGFHAAYDASNGNQVTSVGNALIGAYFARIGLSDRAVAYLTAAAPSDMRWLSLTDAKELGIDLKVLRGIAHPSTVSSRSSSPIPAAAVGPEQEVAGPAQSSVSAADQPGLAAPQTQDVRTLATSAATIGAGADATRGSDR